MEPYDIEKLMGDIISDYESKKEKTVFDCFVFKMKSTEYSIPFDSIISFESGNKKIFNDNENMVLFSQRLRIPLNENYTATEAGIISGDKLMIV
ncbi:MAG: hypothetical protein IKL70_04410 [Oscillospiraceae bacterium]|nr:hypothetical protein [Oscillospiraceae bacterium]